MNKKLNSATAASNRRGEPGPDLLRSQHQRLQGHRVQRDPRRKAAPGIDSTKLHFGRKLRITFHPQILEKISTQKQQTNLSV
jgi:hypothetical protein